MITNNPIGYANPDEMRGKGCFTVAFQQNGHYSEPVYSAALALLPGEPVCHLVWRQARIAADDVQDYYDVARPGDKCVDGSEPFPVYATPVPLIVENVIKIPTTADEAEAMEKTGFAWLREHAPERLTPEGLARPIPPPPPAAVQEPVPVKALEWSDPAEPNETCSYNHVIAKAVFVYSIEWKAWKKYDAFTVYRDGEFLDSLVTLDDAKAAAQADYEARIRSALRATAIPETKP